MKKRLLLGIISTALVIALVLTGCHGGEDPLETEGASIKLSGDVYEMAPLEDFGDLLLGKGISYAKTKKQGEISANIGDAVAALSKSNFSIAIGEPYDDELGDFFEDLLGDELFAGWKGVEITPSSGVKVSALELTLEGNGSIQKSEIEVKKPIINVPKKTASLSLINKSVTYIYVDQDVGVKFPKVTYTLPGELTGGPEITFELNKATLSLKKGWNPLYAEIGVKIDAKNFDMTNLENSEPDITGTVTVSLSRKEPKIRWVIGSDDFLGSIGDFIDPDNTDDLDDPKYPDDIWGSLSLLKLLF
jgi:hypothetical protein